MARPVKHDHELLKQLWKDNPDATIPRVREWYRQRTGKTVSTATVHRARSHAKVTRRLRIRDLELDLELAQDEVKTLRARLEEMRASRDRARAAADKAIEEERKRLSRQKRELDSAKSKAASHVALKLLGRVVHALQTQADVLDTLADGEIHGPASVIRLSKRQLRVYRDAVLEAETDVVTHYSEAVPDDLQTGWQQDASAAGLSGYDAVAYVQRCIADWINEQRDANPMPIDAIAQYGRG